MDTNQLIKKAWKDWTEEEWSNAVYCDTCGLPLLELEPNEENPDSTVGGYICIACTWESDLQFLKAQVVAEKQRLEVEAQRLSAIRQLIHVQTNLITASMETLKQLLASEEERDNARKKLT